METWLVTWLLASLSSAVFMEYIEIKEEITIPTVNFIIFSICPILIIVAILFSLKESK